MTTTTVPLAAPRPPASRRGTIVMLSLAGAIGVLFFFAAAFPYFLSSSYGQAGYATRRGWLMLHIAAGKFALLTGPAQLWLGLANRGLAWHRRMGIAYMTAVGVGSIAAFYLAFHTDGGWAFGAGLSGLAVAWLVTTGMAFVAIRRSLVDQHKEWMIRSYVVTFGFVAFRLILPALQASEVGTLPEQLAVSAWGCWSIPLLVNELVMQGRKVLRTPRTT